MSPGRCSLKDVSAAVGGAMYSCLGPLPDTPSHMDTYRAGEVVQKLNPSLMAIDVPYGRKFWRGIYCGGLAVLRAIRQYFHPPNFFQYVIVTYHYVTSSICRPPSFKMSARKLQTSKEWNENSPDLVYHQLAPASFDVLWFETYPAVFTLLTIPVC